MPRKLAGDWQSRRPYGVRVAESFSESGAVRRFELCSEEKNMPTRLAKCPFAFDLSKPMPMVEALFGPGAKIVQGRAPQISARSTFDFTVFNHEVAKVGLHAKYDPDFPSLVTIGLPSTATLTRLDGCASRCGGCVTGAGMRSNEASQRESKAMREQ
jgi:hypothetical protein